MRPSTDSINDNDVIANDGCVFTYKDHAALAFLIWRRWGRDMAAGAVAWRRLLQNDCSDEDYAALVKLGFRDRLMTRRFPLP